MATDEPSDPTPDTAEAAARRTSENAVWTYRGYEMRSAEFNTAMVHFFRAEVQRSNTWRTRLDTTTNWAVIATGAAISFAFSSRGPQDHGVIILNTVLITIFLLIEARRYRYYEMWAYRVRLLETDFFAAMLVPPFRPAPDWAESLAENLLHPSFPISNWEAIGRRFRRNYMLIYVLLAMAWAMSVSLHPEPATTWRMFVGNAGLGPLPGEIVIALGVVFYCVVGAVGLWTVQLQDSAGEVLPRFVERQLLGRARTAARKGGQGAGSSKLTGPMSDRGAWYRPSRRRAELTTLIITDRPTEVSQRIMTEMHRGVTGMAATGMYSGADRSVLLCALTVTEVAQLRTCVEAADPKAFVIVMPVAQVLGEGFVPLGPDSAAGYRPPGSDAP